MCLALAKAFNTDYLIYPYRILVTERVCLPSEDEDLWQFPPSLHG